MARTTTTTRSAARTAPAGPGETAPVNHKWDNSGSDPRIWRNLPGESARYTVELLPAPGFTQCVPGNQYSMVDPNGNMRLRVTGRSRGETRSVLATCDAATSSTTCTSPTTRRSTRTRTRTRCRRVQLRPLPLPGAPGAAAPRSASPTRTTGSDRCTRTTRCSSAARPVRAHDRDRVEAATARATGRRAARSTQTSRHLAATRRGARDAALEPRARERRATRTTGTGGTTMIRLKGGHDRHQRRASRPTNRKVALPSNGLIVSVGTRGTCGTTYSGNRSTPPRGGGAPTCT